MLSDKIELQRTIVGCLFCILMICFCAPLIHDCRADALPGSISGTVTGFADEKAIEGALVNVYDDGWAFVASTTTDALGRYGIEGLAVGRYYVKASNSQDHEDKYCCFTGTQGSASQVYLQYFSREVDFALFEKTPSVQKDIIIDFGPGIGLWARYSDTSWNKLHNMSPEIIAVGDLDGNGKDDCIIDFGTGVGIWIRYDNATWTKLHSMSAEIITTGDLDENGEDECIMDFGDSYGIYVRNNNTTWTKLHSLSPEIIDTGNLK